MRVPLRQKIPAACLRIRTRDHWNLNAARWGLGSHIYKHSLLMHTYIQIHGYFTLLLPLYSVHTDLPDKLHSQQPSILEYLLTFLSTHLIYVFWVEEKMKERLYLFNPCCTNIREIWKAFSVNLERTEKATITDALCCTSFPFFPTFLLSLFFPFLAAQLFWSSAKSSL